MAYTNLGPLEEDVMDFIWMNGGKVTVKEIHSRLGKKRKIAYTTVMTIMSRLFEKGLLTRKKMGKGYIYQSKESRKQAVRSFVSDVFDRLVDQFGDEAVIAFSDEVKKASKK